MQLGVIFPQTEIGPDPAAIRDFAQAVEGLGYRHLMAYDHVLGADAEHYAPWRGYYRKEDMFHEPFVLFGYLAGLTQQLEMVTGVIIIGQRQTALVAKQAAEVDVLTGGRLRLGIGTGWNPVEYEALGENFHNRGKRSEEQVEVLRALWTQEVVDFKGKWHRIDHAGLNPLPVQRPIPIWFGGAAEAVAERVARMGDGWFPQIRTDSTGEERLERLRESTRAAGRDPSEIGIEGRIRCAGVPPEQVMQDAEAWQKLGSTHLSVSTMGAGFTSVDQHIEAVSQFMDAAKGL